MNNGFIKLWRKSLEAGWLKNHKLWVFWSYCLMKASYKEYDAIIGFQTIHLMPGQFIFGRKKASKEIKMTEQSIRTCLDFLCKAQNLTIKTTNKFSVITIVNWDTYQSNENENNQQSNQQLTNKQPTTNHIQELKELKEIKKSLMLPGWLDQNLWDDFKEHRRKLRKPMTLRAEEMVIKKLTFLREQGHDPKHLISLALERGWQSVFPPNEKGY
jgi:hypothetical protein